MMASVVAIVVVGPWLCACDWTTPDSCGRGTRSVIVSPEMTCIDATLNATDEITGTNGCSQALVIENNGTSVTVPANGQISLQLPASAWTKQGGEATVMLTATLGTQQLTFTATKCLA
jgi:hypothetical protein